MWKKYVTQLTRKQYSNYCREKDDCYISLHNSQVTAMVPNLPYRRTPIATLNVKTRIRDHGMVSTWSPLQTKRKDGQFMKSHSPIDTMLKPQKSEYTDLELRTLYLRQCDCSSIVRISCTLVHLITMVHSWKNLLQSGVYDTPGWQALP